MDSFADTGHVLRFDSAPSHHSPRTIDSSDRNRSINYSVDHEANLIFMQEWMGFKTFWDRSLSIYQPVEAVIIGLGLIGNVLGLLTLLRSQRMNSSPPFIYHRVLVGADLLFCITYFLHLLVKHLLTVPCHRTFYLYWFGAYFAGTLTPALNHICGYIIMYMTLVIAFDRFLALLIFEQYRRWNKIKVAYVVTGISCILAVFFHCWAYFLHGIVVDFRLDDQVDPSKSIVSKPCWDDPVVYHWIKRENTSRIFRQFLKAKDYYNGAIRVGYPVCLCVLTLAVLISFAKRQKKRHRTPTSGIEVSSIGDTDQVIRRSTTSISMSSSNRRKVSSLTIRSDHGSIFGFIFGPSGPVQANQRTIDRLVSPSVRHRQRCERALFYLMIAVILLAFLQVASTESRRILHLIFPPDELFKLKVLPSHVPMNERIANFRFLLYGHQATRIVANFCTAIDRSFVCFLYIAMNNLFRRELLAMLNRIWRRCCPRRLIDYLNRPENNNRSIGGQVEQQLLTPGSSLPPPSPAYSSRSPPVSTSIPIQGTIPSATGRGYSNCRYLGENLVLLENSTGGAQ